MGEEKDLNTEDEFSEFGDGLTMPGPRKAAAVPGVPADDEFEVNDEETTDAIGPIAEQTLEGLGGGAEGTGPSPGEMKPHHQENAGEADQINGNDA